MFTKSLLSSALVAVVYAEGEAIANHLERSYESENKTAESDPNWYSRHHTVTTVHHPEGHWYDNAEAQPTENKEEADNWYRTHGYGAYGHPAYGAHYAHPYAYGHRGAWYDQDNKTADKDANEKDPNWYSRHHTVTTVHHPEGHWYDNAEAKTEDNKTEDNWYRYGAYGHPAYGHAAYGHPAYGYGHAPAYAMAHARHFDNKATEGEDNYYSRYHGAYGHPAYGAHYAHPYAYGHRGAWYDQDNAEAKPTDNKGEEGNYWYTRYHRYAGHPWGYSHPHAWGHRFGHWAAQQDNETQDNYYYGMGLPYGHAYAPGAHAVAPYHYRPYYSHDNSEAEKTDNKTEDNWYYRYAPYHTYRRAYHYRPSYYSRYWYDQDNKTESTQASNDTQDNYYSTHHSVTTIHHDDPMVPIAHVYPAVHHAHHYLTCDAPATAATDFQAGIFRAMDQKYDSDHFRALLKECWGDDQDATLGVDAFLSMNGSQSYHDILHFGLNDWSWVTTDTNKCLTDDKYKLVKEAYDAEMKWVHYTLHFADWNDLGLAHYNDYESRGEISSRLSEANGMWEACLTTGWLQAGTYVGQVATWLFPVPQ